MDENRVKAVDGLLQSVGAIPRSAWGAAPSKIPEVPDSYDWDYTTIVIHHSGRSGDASPQSVQSKHMKKNGWDDIGYHFLVGPGGQIYEGRRLYYKGSHTELANTGKVGVLVMGNFETSGLLGLFGSEPSPAQMTSAARLATRLKGLFPPLKFLGGHKDFKIKTECPGTALYARLDDLRRGAGLLAPPK